MSNEILVHSRQGHNIGIREDTYGVEDWYCYDCNIWIARDRHDYADHLEFMNQELKRENIYLATKLACRKTPLLYRIIAKIMVRIVRCFSE